MGARALAKTETDRDRGPSRGDQLTAYLAWLAVAVALAGAIVLIVVQLDSEKSSPDSTTLGLFVLAAALGFAALAPGRTIKGLRRVTRFKVGGIELGLAEIKRAERVRPPQEDDGVRAEARPRSKGYEACVERLRSRLNWMRELLDLEARENDYEGIAEELRIRCLLTRDEETFVVDLQRYDPVSDDWSTAVEEEFLDDTWAFATRFRALVWDRRVRQKLEEAKWFIADYEQKRGHRPDFLAYRDGCWALIAARIGSLDSEKPDDMDKPARRLWRQADGPAITTRAVIVPDLKQVELTDKLPQEVKDGVRLITLKQFLAGAPEPEAAAAT